MTQFLYFFWPGFLPASLANLDALELNVRIDRSADLGVRIDRSCDLNVEL